MKTTQHTVYRYDDANGPPLYVGVTSNFRNRDSHHRIRASWAPLIASVNCETFADQELAFDREHDSSRR